jgi:hypothetical protein
MSTRSTPSPWNRPASTGSPCKSCSRPRGSRSFWSIPSTAANCGNVPRRTAATASGSTGCTASACWGRPSGPTLRRASYGPTCGSGPEGRGERQARAKKNNQPDRSVAVAGEGARPGEPGREITSVRRPSWLGEVPCNLGTERFAANILRCTGGAGYSGEARCRVGLPRAADPRVRGTPCSQARAAAGPTFVSVSATRIDRQTRAWWPERQQSSAPGSQGSEGAVRRRPPTPAAHGATAGTPTCATSPGVRAGWDRRVHVVVVLECAIGPLPFPFVPGGGQAPGLRPR